MSARNPHKKAKLTIPSSKALIATHSGTFQADEALGVWLLRQTSSYYQSPVLRSRNKDEFSKADIVIDVGGEYDHSQKKYDHHQRGYDERFEAKVKTDAEGNEVITERCTKLSASGLVYRHYGKEVIQNTYPSLSEKELDLVYSKMYNTFMEAIDAVDTGVEQVADGVDLVYKDCTGLSIRVGRLNPRWNEDTESDNIDARFEQASALCGEDFLQVLSQVVESDLPARAFVEQAVLKRHETDSSAEIIKFESGGMPWKGHLYDLEKEHKLDPLVKFVLYTDQGGMWRIQAVTVEGQAFENRLSLPEEWRGVRDEDLTKIAGIEGCKFCHAAGFIGGNETFEGALKMAQVALTRK
eukprot:CAMPEP_0194084054 /NCGR_PEP_ID=MMETSP0149-20130528/11328_1 /TAXON_ID=122233 /ORGANISM="Chaetoceros debilis, Strain MM31A-1" /LENGTH=353 /DNA_ID=CAMNT_0038766595 /DNA_START=72 /DNA_END=1133 /DNA_ORIENTATION=-